MKESGKSKESKNKKSQTKITKYASKSKIWSDDNRHPDCPYKNSKISVDIPFEVFTKIVLLVKNYDTEWLAYLDYEETENGYLVKDLVIPEQEVTSSSVSVINSDIGVGKGVIHYHPFKSGAWHSSTDESYVNRNHPFSLVVDDDLSLKARVAIKVPCGNILTGDGKVNIVITDSLEKFLEDSEQKIKEKKYSYTYVRGTYGGSCYYYGSKDNKSSKKSTKPTKYEDDEVVIDFEDDFEDSDAKCRIFNEKCPLAKDREDAWCVEIGYCIKDGIDITPELLSATLTKEEMKEIEEDIEKLNEVGSTKITSEEVE